LYLYSEELETFLDKDCVT